MAFSHKNALVTGSSRGIGRGIALELARRGARIGIHYFQNKAAAEETLAMVKKVGSSGFLVQADICHLDQVQCMFQQ